MSENTLSLLYITISMLSAVASLYSAEKALEIQDKGEGSGWQFLLSAILLIVTTIFWFVMAIINLPS